MKTDPTVTFPDTAGAMKKLLVVGDSLAGGFPHLCFPAILREAAQRWHITVSAKGGDTLVGVGNRMVGLLPRLQPDGLIFEAGANDLLLPFLERRGGSWKRLVKVLVSRGNLPATQPSAFRMLLEKFLEIMEDKVGTVVLTTIPCLGEDLATPLNRLRETYNHAIREAAEKRGARLAEAAHAFEEELAQLDNPSPYLLDEFINGFLDPLRSFTPRGAFQLSGRRGLILTIDGVHPSPRGARILAESAASAMGDILGGR